MPEDEPNLQVLSLMKAGPVDNLLQYGLFNLSSDKPVSLFS